MKIGRVGRLLRTPLREVAMRGVEHAWGARERFTSGRENVCRLDPPECERMLRRLGARPFFGIPSNDDRARRAELLATYFPHRVAACVAEADSICTGIVRLFGQEVVLRLDENPWTADWQNGAVFPRAFYRSLDLDHSSRRANVKRVWEMNRHQFLVTLGKAYWLTSDEKYAERMISILRSWIAANPSYVGINWKDALELALRQVSWIWALRLISQSAVLEPAIAKSIVSAIALQRDYIEHHLSTYSSPNTHLLGEALGLLIVGCALPDLPRAGRGVNRAMRILDAELDRQVASDGSHRENAPYYHAYALEMYLLAMIVARQTGHPPPRRWAPRLEGMAEFLLWLLRPDGSLARFGDDDGGRTLRLAEEDYYRPRSLIVLSAVLFERPEFKHVAPEPSEELFWLLGNEGIRRFIDLRAEAPRQRLRKFRDARIAIARTGWDGPDLWLACQEHPMGFMTAGHSHGGLLSFELFMGGKPIVVDPGTFTYSALDWRDHFRSAAAHNVVEIDDQPIFVPEGRFGWRRSVGVRMVERDAESDGGIAAGYACDGRPLGVVEHVRRWNIEAPGSLRICDEFLGEGRHRLVFWLHLPPGARVALRRAIDAIEITLHDATVEVVLEGFPAPRLSILEGSDDPVAGWLSPVFDRRVAAPVIRIQEDADFPASRTVWLTMRRSGASSDHTAGH